MAITFFIQVYGERADLLEALRDIRQCYPDCRIIVRFDGDFWPKDALQDYFETDPNLEVYEENRLFTADRGGECVQRMLELFLNGKGDVLIKVDADTRVQRKLTMFRPPEEAWWAGTLQIHGSVQGGCILMSREFCRRLFESKLMCSEELRSPKCAWAFAPVHRQRAFESGLSSHDWCLFYGAEKLRIRAVSHQQVLSKWLTLSKSDFKSIDRYAIIHPRPDKRPTASLRGTETDLTGPEQKNYILDASGFDYKTLSLQVTRHIIRNVPQGSSLLEFGTGRVTRELAKFFSVESIVHQDEFWSRSHSEQKEYSLVLLHSRNSFSDGQLFFSPKEFVERVSGLPGKPMVVIDDVSLLSDLSMIGKLGLGKKIRTRVADNKICVLIYPELIDWKTFAFAALAFAFVMRKTFLKGASRESG